MPNDDLWFEDSGDELDDNEFPEPDDDDDLDDDTTQTVRCPECGAEVYEDAPQCPVCGAYITHTAPVWSGKPTWWIVLGVLGSLALILALTGLAGW